VELWFNPDECFKGIGGTDIISNTTWTSLLKNEQISSFVKELETSYKEIYQWLQGQDRKLGDYCMHCDPYARKVVAASVQKVSKRSDGSILAIEMKVTSTCQGCNGLTGSMGIFDRPTAPGITQVPKPPTFNCACTKDTGENRVRAPYESEFGIQLQQVAQTYKNRCVRKASACSFGTPFQLDMEIDIDVDGTSLTETQRSQAIEAFMRASNTAYGATVSNCQPEFRRLEQSSSHSFAVRSRHTEDSSVGEPIDASYRDLQKANYAMKIRLKTDGKCNACSNKAFVSNRADTLKIKTVPKSRQLQQNYQKSNCFCPLGSSVAQEPVGRDTLMRLFQEELNLIGSPIKNVTSMLVVADSSKKRMRRVRRLQDTSPSPATMRALQSETIPDPPSVCPMVKLDFNNVTNPLAQYYGQSATLKAGDYLYDQLWWSHGVKVMAHSRFRAAREVARDYMFIPKFVRGTGWVDVLPQMDWSDVFAQAGAVRLFDTMRPTASTDSRYHQPLCVDWEQHGDIGAPHLGSPNQYCVGGGPGTL